MKFSELESFMYSQGITTLADISRALSTTPQAVSNWKSRDQVPYHIAAKLNEKKYSDENPKIKPIHISSNLQSEDSISLSDIMVTIAEQLKVIFLTIFTFIFLTFTFVQFIQQPKYVSTSTILLPENQLSNLGGLAGLAGQFGVNVPTSSSADLSSPSLFPELLRSRTFAEKILDKNFYTNKFGKKLSLLAILTHGNEQSSIGKDTLITKALSHLREILSFEQDPLSGFSTIRVEVFEPVFAKQLAEVALNELESLNSFYKTQTTSEKINFISNRIFGVETALEFSEVKLKEFNERNRQISSPSLQLLSDRLTREVEIQKGIYLTLKQQLELAKIEEVQKGSIVQVLDSPQIPIGPSNKNIIKSTLGAGFVGAIIGILIGFFRSFLDNSDKQEKKKIRRMKHFLNKKTKDIILDRRILGIVNILLLLGLPFYLGSKSKIPVYFGMYSAKLLTLNIIYILTLITLIILFIYIGRKNKNV